MVPTGRSKTSVHFHIHKIELSPSRKAELRIINKKRLLALSPNRKGVNKVDRKI